MGQSYNVGELLSIAVYKHGTSRLFISYFAFHIIIANIRKQSVAFIREKNSFANPNLLFFDDGLRQLNLFWTCDIQDLM